MRAFLRVVGFLLAALLPVESAAQAFCVEAEPPRCGRRSCPQSIGLSHATVGITDGNALHRRTDLSLRTSNGVFEFQRSYNSSNAMWSYYGGPIEDVPKPFGSTGGGDSLRWWHNFYSFVGVDDLAVPESYYIRDHNGSITLYDNCTAPYPCWTVPSQNWWSVEDRLERTTNGFTYYSIDGTRRKYEAKFVKQYSYTKYFLSAIEDSEGRAISTIEYELPSGLTCAAGDSGTTPGVPYIKSVTSPDGKKLAFTYKSLPGDAGQECVLSTLKVSEWNGGVHQETDALEFVYSSMNGEYAGLLATVRRLHSGDEFTYSYTGGDFSEFLDGNLVSSLNGTLNGRMIDVDTPTGEDLSIAYSDNSLFCGTWDQDPQCCDSGISATRTVTDHAAGSGSFSGSQPGFAQEYETVYDAGQLYGGRVAKFSESCSNVNACSAGTVLYEWTCSEVQGAPGHEKAIRNKRGYWTFFDRVPSTVAGVPPQLKELVAKKLGATDSLGNGALLTKAYTYVYGSRNEQLQKTEERESLVGATGEKARTTRLYDADNRLSGIIRSGWTRSLAGTPTQKFVGLFFLKSRTATGNCAGSASDPHGRTLEIRGPCFVTSESATACSGTSYPVKQIHYYADDAVHNGRGLLEKVVEFPESCAGSPLETRHSSYDPFGNPTTVTDPNGVASTFEYVDGKLSASTIDGRRTEYGYNQERLAIVKRPLGNYEVFCYRSGTTGSACVGGAWSGRLQWIAKSAVVDGATWSEKVAFAYWPDGSLKEARFLDACDANCDPAAETVRRIEKYAQDAHRRTTYAGWGGASGGGGAYFTPSTFDGANNRTGVGLPYNAAPEFCGGRDSEGMPLSKNCAALWYDRADRLSKLDLYPAFDSSTGIRTFFGYDAQGNLRDIEAGCSTADASAANCAQPNARHDFDDFGNLIELRLPTSGSGGTQGFARFEYGPLGELLRRETQAMRDQAERVEYTYDFLGRQKSAIRVFAGGTEVLYRFAYDNSATLDSSCLQPANAKGRLLNREDSFGKTWYRYDARGNVVGEIRLRGTTTTCTGAANDNPNTTYSYNANGILSSVVYPHGRIVTYVFGTGARLDRVASIDITSHDGTTWSSQRIVENIRWEPFGALRSYQMNHAGTQNTSNLSYALGNASAAPSSSCPVNESTANDLTGRLRGVRVSTGTSDDGDIYQRTYTWSRDQVSRMDTCYLGVANPQIETFDSYDQLLRLTGASRPLNNFGETGGAFAVRTYGYDSRSNRSTEASEDCPWTSTFDSAYPDRQTRKASACTSHNMAVEWQYDSDGRVTDKKFQGFGSVAQGQIGFDYSGAARDSVFKAVSVGGGYYNYFYDALGRRRKKSYPTGEEDEFFHDSSSHLLADQGANGPAQTYFTVDDYVWLGGRPLAVIRGKFDGTWARQSDSSIDCGRNGEVAPCGLRFIVSDHIGKPVVLLDSSRRITSTGEYDPFGHANRVSLNKEAIIGSGGSSIVAEFQPGDPAPGLLSTDYRVLFHALDIHTGTCVSDVPTFTPPEIRELGGTVLAYGPTGGGSVWSSWFTPSGAIKVEFTSTGYCPGYDQADRCRFMTGCNSSPPFGDEVIVAGYEFRRHEPGTSHFAVPLRFPGQYYDAETDLFENWNRYYDPSTGRYLQPEPLLENSRYVASVARSGYSVPAYAYAANSPLNIIDPDGLRIAIGRVAVKYHHDGVGPRGPGWADTTLLMSGSRGRCEQQCDGTWKFDAKLNPNINVYLAGLGAGQAYFELGGVTYLDHENYHVEDYVEGLTESALNGAIATEGFGSEPACEAARESFGSKAHAYGEYIGNYSHMMRDAYDRALGGF